MLLIEILMEQIKLIVVEKHFVKYQKNLSKKYFLCFFDNQDSDARDKIDTSLPKQFTTMGNYPKRDWITNLNLIFLEKSEYQSQRISKLLGLFGIILRSISQKDLKQQTLFGKKIAVLDLGLISIMKKLMYKTGKICRTI